MADYFYPQNTGPWPGLYRYPQDQDDEFVFSGTQINLWIICRNCGVAIRLDFGYTHCPYCGKPLYVVPETDNVTPPIENKYEELMKKLNEIDKKISENK